MSRRSRRYEKVEFDDFEEEDEVTRCVCGHSDLDVTTISLQLTTLLQNEYQIKIDQGLFIQCDKCSVWQHGFCVGLFRNDDVPDKYWCELCKPDLHLFIFENDQKRTLYKPVSEKRKKLMMLETAKLQNNRKFTRKDRRNYDFDEQLQKALRESARESGLQDSNDNPQNRSESSETPEEQPVKKNSPTQSIPAIVEPQEDAESDMEEDGGDEIKQKPKPKKIKKKEVKRVKKPKEITFTKEELLNQASKPRFVNGKSTIYELRKRISAILEWLNRSQLELEDEKLNKASLNNDIMADYNENLSSMQSLTKLILNWEEKFGKFVP